MAMKRYKRAVAKTGTYIHPQSQQEKNRYCNIGTLFRGENDDGTPYLSLKIEQVPVGGDWDGWVSFFDFDEKKPANKQPAPKTAPRQAEPAFDDDIPF